MFAVVKGWQTFACGEAIMLSRHDALHITARQLREFVLAAQPSGFLSRLLAGNCQGGKPVWRSFCCHGARGLCHGGGTSSWMIEDSTV